MLGGDTAPKGVQRAGAGRCYCLWSPAHRWSCTWPQDRGWGRHRPGCKCSGASLQPQHCGVIRRGGVTRQLEPRPIPGSDCSKWWGHGGHTGRARAGAEMGWGWGPLCLALMLLHWVQAPTCRQKSMCPRHWTQPDSDVKGAFFTLSSDCRINTDDPHRLPTCLTMSSTLTPTHHAPCCPCPWAPLFTI